MRLFKAFLSLLVIGTIVLIAIVIYQKWPLFTTAPVQVPVTTAPVVEKKVVIDFPNLPMGNRAEFRELVAKLSEIPLALQAKTARECRKYFDYERYASIKVIEHNADFDLRRVYVEHMPHERYEEVYLAPVSIYHVLDCFQDEWQDAARAAGKLDAAYKELAQKD